MNNTIGSSGDARARLRHVHERQAAALAEFVAARAKVDKVRLALAAAEGKERSALGKLADAAGVDIAAELAGVAVAKSREALAAIQAGHLERPEPVAAQTATRPWSPAGQGMTAMREAPTAVASLQHKARS